MIFITIEIVIIMVYIYIMSNCRELKYVQGVQGMTDDQTSDSCVI